MSLYLSPHTVRHLRLIQDQLDQLHVNAPPRALLVPGSPEPARRVIIFTGSFNPPTLAHLAMLKQARYYAQAHLPMNVYAAFTKLTVDKESVEYPLLLDRITLLQRILRTREPHAGIMLFNRGLYVEQAQAIRASFSHVRRVFFLIGFDKVLQIFDPHYYKNRDAALEELFAQAELLVAPRGDEGVRELEELLAYPENQRFARYVYALPLSSSYRNISSTRVREKDPLALHEVPQEVRQFMHETRAYDAPLHLRDGSTRDYYEERVRALTALLGKRAIS
jgi:nicotinic acid mononucleotide adenylyltransferase